MCGGGGGDEVRGTTQDGARPRNGVLSVAGGQAHCGRELAAGKGGSSEVECGRGSDSKMGEVMRRFERKVCGDFFYFSSSASDRIDSVGPFKQTRPTNMGVWTIGYLIHIISVGLYTTIPVNTGWLTSYILLLVLYLEHL